MSKTGGTYTQRLKGRQHGLCEREDKQVMDMNETKESQCVSDDLWKPSIGEKLWICEEDGTVWTVGISEEENKVIAKPSFW